MLLPVSMQEYENKNYSTHTHRDLHQSICSRLNHYSPLLFIIHSYGSGLFSHLYFFKSFMYVTYKKFLTHKKSFNRLWYKNYFYRPQKKYYSRVSYSFIHVSKQNFFFSSLSDKTHNNFIHFLIQSLIILIWNQHRRLKNLEDKIKFYIERKGFWTRVYYFEKFNSPLFEVNRSENYYKTQHQQAQISQNDIKWYEYPEKGETLCIECRPSVGWSRNGPCHIKLCWAIEG